MFEDKYDGYEKGLAVLRDVNQLSSYDKEAINQLYVKHFGKTEAELVEEWKNYINYKVY